MKHKLKKSSALALILALAMQSLCYANTATDKDIPKESAPLTKEAKTATKENEATEAEEAESYVLSEHEEAGAILGSTIKFIQENYVGQEVDTQTLVNAALKGMGSVLDDYSSYLTMDEYEEFEKTLETELYVIGVFVTQADNDYPVVSQILENTPASKANIEIGDKIISLNSISLKGVSLTSVTKQIISKGEKNVELEISRGGKLITVNTSFAETKVNTVYSININELVGTENRVQNDNIGYIKVELISLGTEEEFKKAVNLLKNQGKKRLILDLRGNVGGVVDEALKMCDLIVPDGKIISTTDKIGNKTEIYSELKKPYFDKIVVLTDGTTASAAEMIASAVKESGAGIVVGTKTFGKGVIQTVIPVLDYGVLKMTTHEYFSRNGNKINHIGVEPDVVVNVPLFLSENDNIEGDKVKNALDYLGYDISSRIRIMNAIGKIQKEKNLKITRTITKETANEINLRIYAEMNNNDKILMAGYEEILK